MGGLLSLKNIYQSFGQQEVLRGINLDIIPGKIYLIKGRSGCGKSTLLNICSLIEKPLSGEVILNGKNVLNCNDDELSIMKQDIGYIFQDFNLFENLSVFENLYIYLQLVTNMSKEECIQKINLALAEYNMQHKLSEKVKLLSGGERQRITVIRTLLTEKKIIYADEPSANIDDENINIMKHAFQKERQRGAAVLIVTHDTVFDDIADCIYHIEQGVLVCED